MRGGVCSPPPPPLPLLPLLSCRFRSNKFVVGEPYLRFYAGAPLVSSYEEGHRYGTGVRVCCCSRASNPRGRDARGAGAAPRALDRHPRPRASRPAPAPRRPLPPPAGTLCVFDFRPRRFDAGKYAMLAHFAEIVVREMERDMVRRQAGGAPAWHRAARSHPTPPPAQPPAHSPRSDLPALDGAAACLPSAGARLRPADSAVGAWAPSGVRAALAPLAPSAGCLRACRRLAAGLPADQPLPAPLPPACVPLPCR